MAASPRITGADYQAVRELNFEQVEDLLKLQKAAQKIASILDLDQLIEKVINEVAVSFGCVEANLYLHHEEQGELTLAGVHGCTQYGKGYRFKVGKEGMVGYVAGTGQMRYAPDVRRDPYYMACEHDTLSELAIPLHSQGQLVGVFTASHHELDAFPPEQIRLLQALCSHIAVAVQNARLFQKERQANDRMKREVQEARTIQQALLPKSSPYVPGFLIAGLSIPAGAVGGDWYDFIPLEDGRWGLILADVSGKGTAAALLMSATRAMLRSLAEACCNPGDVLGRLNRLLVEDFPLGKFVTMVYAILNPSNRTVTFANAGHLRPLLVDPFGARFLDTETGMPLGLGFGSYSEVTVHLPENSRLVFYSDGITEAVNPQDEEYGSARLRDCVLQDRASAESIVDSVRAFANGPGLTDDATVIFVQA